MLNSLVAGVVVLNLLALGMVVARAPVFGTRLYRPMLLNLALSAAPLLVLVVAATVWTAGTLLGARVLVDVLAVLALLVWLLLLPNAGYLITELNQSHRRPDERVPEWYDVLLVLSLAMSGVLNTVLNVFLLQLVYVEVQFGGDTALPLAGAELRAVEAVVLLLVAFGIYLGRTVRVNSWDVLRPWRLVRAVLDHLRTPGAAGNALGFTLIAALFLATMHLVIIGPVIHGLVQLEQARH